MSRCLIIINPVSGGGRARRYVMELQWQLSALFDRLEVKFTHQAGDATQFAIERTSVYVIEASHFDGVAKTKDETQRSAHCGAIECECYAGA